MEDGDGFLSSLPYFAVYFGHKKYNTILKMPSVLLSDYLAADLEGPDTWPEEIVMYEPQQVGQILLYENASCLAVQTFFKMAGVKLRVEQRPNAEFMSPSGKVPFVRCGSFYLTELDRIASFLKEKNRAVGEDLEERERADMRAYMALVNNVLLNAELYICWVHDITYHSVTSARYGSVYPWPLNRLLTWRKRYQILGKLAVLDWRNKTMEVVLENVDHCLKAFSGLLQSGPWFFGSKPTELDALVFGHLFTILTTPLPDSRLSEIVNKYENLVEFCKKVENDYFEKLSK